MNATAQRIWKTPVALALCRNAGCSDPGEVLKGKARSLIERSGVSHPPFSPFLLGSLMGVVRVKFRPMGFDACLTPVDGGYEVQICSHHPQSRQNFSMAHEVGHLLIMESTGQQKIARREKKIGSSPMDDEEEYLCDVSASELLLPTPFFDDDVYAGGPSMGSVLKLANLYSASVEATVLKFVQTNIWKCMFLYWKLVQANSCRKLAVERCLTRSGFSLLAKDEISLRDESKMLDMVGTRKISRGREWLRLGGIEDRYYMETVQIGPDRQPRFLSIVVTEPFAEHTVRRRNLGSHQPGLFDSLR